MKLLGLIFRNLRRNLLRTILTAFAIALLVLVFSMIQTVVLFLDQAVAQQAADVALVLTERYRLPSRFDKRFYDDVVNPGSKVNRELIATPGFNPDKATIWHFIAFKLDPDKDDSDNSFFCIATLPERIPAMIDGLEGFDTSKLALMDDPPNSSTQGCGVIAGPSRLKRLKKKVGDVFEATSVSHRDAAGKPLKIELEIVAELPGESRWAEGMFMNYRYLERLLDTHKSSMYGKVNLGWLKVGDQQAATATSAIIEDNMPELKSETGASGVARFLEPYKSPLWTVKWILRPAIAIVLIIIVANAINITVRERMREMAVMKVLGFRPGQILFLILGESFVLGLVCGLLGAFLTYGIINWVRGGIKIPFAFFPIFFVPVKVILWGALPGTFTACAGAIIPALRARNIRVAEVFAKVA